jgi:hypothetical protein
MKSECQMNKLAIVFAVGAAAMLGGSTAHATDNTVKARAAADVKQQPTDFSSRGRHYRHHHHHHRHYGYRAYRPYYGNSYGYYQPRPYYGYGYGRPYGYGYGGPGITFSFGARRGWY